MAGKSSGATAQMIAFIEWACVAALQPYLAPQQRTVALPGKVR